VVTDGDEETEDDDEETEDGRFVQNETQIRTESIVLVW
jgi:hypothetical protein